MMSDLHGYLARVLVDDRVREASERQRALAPEEPGSRAREAHSLQRALVRTSLLMSRRDDAATERRWA
jgi:hypothetical protein